MSSRLFVSLLAAALVVACDPYAICFPDQLGEPCPGDFDNTCTAAEGAYVCAPSCSDNTPCPIPTEGVAPPKCVADPITGRGVCVLECEFDSECPTSQGCDEGVCAALQT